MDTADQLSLVGVITLISLLITIIYSLRKGGIKELIENIFLWFLLLGGISQVFLPPVDTDDEMTAGVFFLAFGMCRIAKAIAKKTEVAQSKN